MRKKIEYNDKLGKGFGFSMCVVGGSGDSVKASNHVLPLAYALIGADIFGRIILIDPKAVPGRQVIGVPGYQVEIITITMMVKKILFVGDSVIVHGEGKQESTFGVTHVMNDAFSTQNQFWMDLQSQMLQFSGFVLLKKPKKVFFEDLNREIEGKKLQMSCFEQFNSKTEQRVVINGSSESVFPASQEYGCGCSSCEDMLSLAEFLGPKDVIGLLGYVNCAFCVMTDEKRNIYSNNKIRSSVYGCLMHGHSDPKVIRTAIYLDGYLDQFSEEHSVQQIVVDVHRWVYSRRSTELSDMVVRVIGEEKLIGLLDRRKNFDYSYEKIHECICNLPLFKLDYDFKFVFPAVQGGYDHIGEYEIEFPGSLRRMLFLDGRTLIDGRASFKISMEVIEIGSIRFIRMVCLLRDRGKSYNVLMILRPKSEELNLGL